MKVSIYKIFIPTRLRREYGNIDDFARDLHDNGQITPITVRPPTERDRAEGLTDEEWVLIAGGRRIAAAMKLRWKEIEVFPRVDEIDELKHTILELHENLQRQNMTWQETVDAQAKILQLRQLLDPSLTQAQVAVDLGIEPSTLNRAVKTAEILKERPHLRRAKSAHSARKAADMEQNTERLTAREVMNLQKSERFPLYSRRIKIAKAQDYLRQEVAPRSVDLILTDPPFGINYWSQGHKDSGENNLANYDDSLEATMDLLADVVPLWVRAIRETGWIVVFMQHELYGYLENLFKNCCAEHCDYKSEIDKKRCSNSIEEASTVPCRFLKPEEIPWVWFRPNSRNKPRYPDRHAQNAYELIMVVNAGKARLNYACQNLITADAEYGSERLHPNQKPFELAKEIINRTTMIGDTVMDTSFGSGRMLAAAASISRMAIGCDSNPNMHGICLGMVAKYFVPLPKNADALSEKRYQAKLQDAGIGVTDFSEVESNPLPQEEAASDSAS